MTTPSPRTVVESEISAIDPDAQARHANDGELSARFQCDMKPLREPIDCRAMRMTRNHADAEDLLQDTLVKAYAYLWHLYLFLFMIGIRGGSWGADGHPPCPRPKSATRSVVFKAPSAGLS
jgi:hypothetical protein